MTITYYNELSLFQQAIDDERHVLSITCDSSFHGEQDQKERRSLEIPLEPAIEGLATVSIDMHGSPTEAYMMDEKTNRFFSDCVGYETILTYLGPHRRKVLGNIAPKAATEAAGSSAQSWLGSMARALPSMMGMAAKEEGADQGITFADIAPYLVVTEESLKDVSRRLQDGLEMDVTKFRPNIVVEGAGDAWDEDFWGGITITGQDNEKTEIELTSNCARCVSVNVDYDTGRPAKGDEGSVLKKLMVDRRVDRGTKWSPVFGRYGFLRGEERCLKIGDEVIVSKRNEERTTFGKFQLSIGDGRNVWAFANQEQSGLV